MKANIKKQVVDKLTKYNMNFAAMDWDHNWFCYENKPNCVDDAWDVKTGHYMPLHTIPTSGFDWRDSLVQT